MEVRSMKRRELKAKFVDFNLPDSMKTYDATAAIPVSKGLQQIWYFLNLKDRRGLMVKFPPRHEFLSVEALGFLYHFSTFVMNKEHRLFPRLRTIFGSYHNGLSYFEMVFKLSKPHGITSLGKGRYLVSLWASSNFYVIDLNARTIESRNFNGGNGRRVRPGRVTGAFAPKERQEIFSTYQFFDKRHNQTYFTTFLRERGDNVERDRHVTIKKYDWDTDQVAEVWDGEFGEATHYIAVSAGGRHLGLAQFGDFFDSEKNLLPSRILVLDMKDGKEWWIDNAGWAPTAHIDWDPVEDNVCYLSCHNGVIVPNHDPPGVLFQKGIQVEDLRSRLDSQVQDRRSRAGESRDIHPRRTPTNDDTQGLRAPREVADSLHRFSKLRLFCRRRIDEVREKGRSLREVGCEERRGELVSFP